MARKKTNRFQIAELFLIKAGMKDFTRCYTGTIQTEKDEKGNTMVRCKVTVEEGYIIGMSENRDKLGKNLDDICLMKLDFGLHQSNGIFSKIAELDFNHN